MSAEPIHVDVIDQLRAMGIDVPNIVGEDETAGEILSDETTLSIHDAQEERDTSLPHDFDYVPSRDLTFDSQNLFTTDEKCATDPTYKEPEMIEIPDQWPSYVLNPIIPPSSYARNLLTLE